MTTFTYASIKYSVDLSPIDWFHQNIPVELPDGTYLLPVIWDETKYPPIPINFRECKAPELYSRILIAQTVEE
jgi:hypothetical protein